MTNGAKVLLGVVAALLFLLASVGRYEVHQAGPRNVMAWVHDRWTGTVQLCAPNGSACYPIHPAVARPPVVVQAAQPRAQAQPDPGDWITPPEPAPTRR